MYAESSTPTVPCSVFVCRSISETDVALQPCQKELLHVMIHLYNVYKTASFLTSFLFFRLFTFCPLLFLRPFALPFHVHHFFLLLPLPLSPSFHNVPLFVALPCLLDFCLSTFFEDLQDLQQSQKRFSMIFMYDTHYT